MIRLGVNIDHVATVRQARRTYEPDPVAAASVCLLAGADGITIHLREDRRHIQDRDLRLLRETVPFGLNLEMAVADEVVELAVRTKPDQVTLVPEKREELTTEGGLDVVGQFEAVKRAVDRLLAAGIPVSMFIAPDAAQIDASKRLGAYAVELHTGRFAETWKPVDAGPDFPPLVEAARHASASGMRVHLGHGLNYHNVGVVCGIPKVEELNIGHAIVAKAIFVGLDRAVRDMKEAMGRARPSEGT